MSNTQLERIARPSSASYHVSLEMSVASDYDKLKRIGHLVRVPLELSVKPECDKLKRIGHLVRVPP